MESTETPQHHRGGIYNYFQGATINNLVINGNMVKNGSDQYTSNSEAGKKATPEMMVRALEQCKDFVWGNAAYSVAFCVCRDVYNMENNATNFERILTERGIAVPEGTINSAIFRNPWLKYHVDKWKEMGAPERALKLKEEFILQVENIVLQAGNRARQ